MARVAAAIGDRSGAVDAEVVNLKGCLRFAEKKALRQDVPLPWDMVRGT